MSPEEAKDLEALHIAQDQKRRAIVSYLRDLDRMSPDQLKLSGYRNGNAEAMRDAFRRMMKDMDKLIAEHIKKYPDER